MKLFHSIRSGVYRRISSQITRTEHRKTLRADRKARIKALKLARSNGCSWRGESKLESSRQKQRAQSHLTK